MLLERDWEVLWNWRRSHRIQTLRWLVAHGHILTNCCRSRWGWVYHPRISIENDDEIVLHVFRDCTHTYQVWNRLVSPDWVANFCFVLLIAEFRKNLNKRWNEVVILGCKQRSWLYVGICEFGEINQFSKKDSKDQLTQPLLSKISLEL
jgi:hypothetical protein